MRKTNTTLHTYKFKRFLMTSGIIGFSMMPHFAMAQVEDATQIADPARVSQDLLDSADVPTTVQEIAPRTRATPSSAPSGAENITFTLKEISISGVSAFTAEDLAPYYNDKLGQTVTLADMYDIKDSLTRKYRNAGYILSQVVVPPQTVEDGTFELRAIEGRIDQITIDTKSEKLNIPQIQDIASNLQGAILDAKELERYILLLNDMAGVTARSVLSPSKTVTGASDLTIIIEHDTFEATTSFDNYGSRFLGVYQLGLSATTNSFFGMNERISAQFVQAGDRKDIDELLFGSVIYEQPINKYGTQIRLAGSYTSTEPGSTLDDFDVLGQSQFLGATLTHPIMRSRAFNWSGRLGFDLRDVNSKNDLEPVTREDRIRSVRIGSRFQFSDNLIGVGVNALDFQYSQGLSAFGASHKGEPDNTRANGDPSYKKFEVQAQRLQRIAPKVNVLVAASGQLAASALLSSEEFGVGGRNFGRAYDSSAIVGDDGIAGKVEAQWNTPRPINHIKDYQLFSFYDIGQVWDQDATTSDGKRESLASTGLGVRASLTETTKADFSVAVPLTRPRDAGNDNDPRFYFSLRHAF